MIPEIGGPGQHARTFRRWPGTSPSHRPPARWRRRRPGHDRLPGGAATAGDGTPAVLRDGSAVLIRQVRSTDGPLLADGFARLSRQSRQARFLTGKISLSAAELHYLTSLDHHDHEALGALSHADGRGVGVARYVRDGHDPRTAEIAVTVIDEWQGRGLGTELLKHLSDRARQEGIHRFTALVATGNNAAIRLLRQVGATLIARGPGTREYEIPLMPAHEPSRAGWLRALDDGIAAAWR